MSILDEIAERKKVDGKPVPDIEEYYILVLELLAKIEENTRK